VTAVWSEDVDCTVHVLRENGTVTNVASLNESFKLRNRGSAGAVKGNPSELGILLFTFSIKFQVVRHCFQKELILLFANGSRVRVHKEMESKFIVNQSDSLDGRAGIIRRGKHVFVISDLLEIVGRRFVSIQVGWGASENCLDALGPSMKGVVNSRIECDVVGRVHHLG